MKRKSFTPKGLVSRTGALASAFAATLLILGTAGAAAAQDGAVAGQVTAETGEAVQGVQVFIPGTSFGTLTDEAGRYRLTGVPAGQHTLRASIIGYRGSDQLVTVTAGEVATVDFVLPVSAVALDEVVATITGDVRRRTLATDIPVIDATTVADNTRANRITDILKGQATGVIVRQSSGTVGGGADVRIRGTSSISLSNQPLYVVDGAIIDSQNQANDPFFTDIYVGGQNSSRINDLNPDEIESIEVIKGPAAAALWGSRANAGVIIITTKKGGGDARWQARADLGAAHTTNDFRTSFWNPLSFGFLTDTLYSQNLLQEFDPFQDGLYQNYNGNLSGGSGIMNYFGSVQYTNEKGTVPNNSQEKFNFRANLGADPSDKLNLSFSNGFSSSNLFLPDNDNDGFGYIGVALIGFTWNHPITATDPITGETVQTCPFDVELSKLIGVPTTVIDGCPDNSFFGGRTFEDVASIVTEQKVERYTGSGIATWEPVSNWTNRFTLGYDMFSNRTTNLFAVDPDLPFGTNSLGDINKPTYTSRNLTMMGTTSYLLNFSSDVSLDATGGVQWFRSTKEATQVLGQVFPASGQSVGNSVLNQADDAFDELKALGFFVQGQFGVKDRLFVTGGVRWDNNSAFGENLGTQTYPKLGASFVALEGHSFFNMLKFRGAWGRSGRQPDTNDALALLTTTQVSLQGADQLGVSPDRPGNASLEPELGEEWEAGVDMAFWNDRIGLTLTYFNSKTDNTVVTKNLAPSLGFPSAVFTNIGQIQNKGFEIEFDALALDTRNFTWDWRFIFTHAQNRINELEDPIPLNFGDMRHQEGLPFASYYSERLVIGADGLPEVLTCADTPGTWGPDDPQAKPEDFCDPADDHRFIGRSVPVDEGSLQTTLTLFKYVTLFALLDFQAGHFLANSTQSFMCDFLGGPPPLNGTCEENFETGPDGEPTDEALLISTSASIASDAIFTYDADWAKLRTVQARFDMPPSVTRFLKLRGLSFSLIGENLVTWTDYPGQDPEITWRGQFQASRSEFLTLPPPRRFIGSVNITF